MMDNLRSKFSKKEEFKYKPEINNFSKNIKRSLGDLIVNKKIYLFNLDLERKIKRRKRICI